MEQILLSGSSGLIGGAYANTLKIAGIETIRLVRKSSSSLSGDIAWDPYASVPISDCIQLARLEGLTAAVHLSGANLAGRRWTESYKDLLYQSRVKPTHALATMLAAARSKPRVLICASAVGIYGNQADTLLSESSPPGEDFLATLCQAWEAAAQPAVDAGIRVVHLRFGVVLSGKGGALARMLPIFRAGLGGRLGSGRQWMSWIGLKDVTRVIDFAIAAENLSGAVNAVAPNPVTNRAFTHTMGSVLGRPTLIPVPAPALELAFGEMAQATLLASQRAIPRRLTDEGFIFETPDLESSLHLELTAAAPAVGSRPREQ